MLRSVWRVEKKPVTVIFKTMACPNDNKEAIRRIKEEFELSMKAYQAARDGVVAPISFQEIEDNELLEHVIESVIEYGGADLLTALKNSAGEKGREGV